MNSLSLSLSLSLSEREEQKQRKKMMEKTEEQGTCPSSSSSSSKWKKVVYGGMQPGFQDNHTDSSFLEAMVMNANVVKRDTWTAIRDSVAISQYVCVLKGIHL